MKYMIGAILIVIIGFFAFVNNDNKKDLERLKQAEVSHQQKLEQERLDAIQSEKDAEAKKLADEQHKAKVEEQTKLATAQQVKQHEQAQETKVQAEFKKIEDKVKEYAFDADSLKFRNQRGNCGEVNGKNKFGGYIGFKRYIYFPGDNTVAIESDSKDSIFTASIMDKLWSSKCS